MSPTSTNRSPRLRPTDVGDSDLGAVEPLHMQDAFCGVWHALSWAMGKSESDGLRQDFGVKSGKCGVKCFAFHFFFYTFVPRLETTHR
ncbi:MAG: hypothetical protein K2H04_09405 [Bacteroidaceae bacterium]|nr:hypothetical protein [Bacteroidaceae bacterium]